MSKTHDKLIPISSKQSVQGRRRKRSASKTVPKKVNNQQPVVNSQETAALTRPDHQSCADLVWGAKTIITSNDASGGETHSYSQEKYSGFPTGKGEVKDGIYGKAETGKKSITEDKVKTHGQNHVICLAVVDCRCWCGGDYGYLVVNPRPS
jgi:hypothetical protein